MSKTGKTITIECEVCKSNFVLLESQYRSRTKNGKRIRFCSVKCMGLGFKIPESKVEIPCGVCGKVITKRRDHLLEKNFCSRACSAKNKTLKSPDKWNNPQYVKSYMQEYQKRNKDKINANKKEYLEQNKDQKLATQKRYRQNHRDYINFIARVRKQKVYSANFDASQWEEIKKNFNYTCPSCGRIEPAIKLEMDHVVPLVLGGKHSLDNIQPLCRSCNASKATKIIDYRINYPKIELRIVK